ncbi:hypothetical protein H6G54_17925 [Anabaena cylindrica FACHB-243]|uniref:Uncharacterized protein n=1 Tax=Anabaena cylindrica (strain ATCC 27899 / PCC 7122) TaxID=272123 RepID=K9ZN52_ANACC|nr:MULTISPECIES: hypothetical protein [Anabaena]AFZ60673.1 hypothetical protein Anacy_5352 [Anabaena cylindrica PCC 7122]MBD2419545.1 hypothetical protein [Anabaena cylindrica FACHB-243]MBY5282756.1 hypothetical protein [Anabaena sp. CCAP 1446/1C]MBY5309094.1 hypothetical protein [Anabaena sp. CCAP 1446/1C]MCM2409739.1 hypothetical protein [Anabaena sp. CCAP 1446/1C]
MPTYNVSDVLEIIKTLTPEQKLELQRELPSVLAALAKDLETPTKSQAMSRVTITGSSNIDLSQIQAEQGSSITNSKTQATLQNTDLPELLSVLEKLKQSVVTNSTLNPLDKKVAELQIQTIKEEAQKPKPDKSLVDQAITALKKGLAGVAELAEPVIKVSSLVAKAWMVIP